jgi:hypothetical protein
VVSPLPSMRWHVDSGDDELVDVVAPLLTAKRVDLGFFFEKLVCNNQCSIYGRGPWWCHYRSGRALVMRSRWSGRY